MLIFSGHKGRLRSIAFSNDGQLLASCAGSGLAISLWDTAHARRLGFLSGHSLRVSCLAFSPGSDNLLASSAGSDPICLWDTVSRKPIGRLRNSFGTASGLSFSSDGRILAVSFKTWGVYSIAWSDTDAPAWDKQGPLKGSTMSAFSLALIPGGRSLVVGHDRGIDWWELDPVKRRDRHPRAAPVRAVVCSSDGRTVALSSRDEVTLWDTNSRTPRLFLHGHTRQINSLSFSPDNRTLASASNDGTVRFWDVESGEQREAFDWQLGRVWTIAFAPDGMRTAAGGDRGTLILWDVDQ